MRRLAAVLLLGVFGLCWACGPQEDESASTGEQPADTVAQTQPDSDRGDPVDTPATKPDPEPETKFDPPQLDPPQINPPTGDPPVILPPPVAPVVDPVPQPVPPVAAPETGPPPIAPAEGTGDTNEEPSTTAGEEDVVNAIPSGGRAINLSVADSGKTVSAGVGDLVIIELDANPTTGYGWEPDSAAENAALVLKSKRFLTLAQMNPEMQPVPGQGGVTTFTYQVADTGQAAISLAYRRAWEKDVAPAKTFKVTIEATRKTSPVVTGQLVFSQEPDVNKISRIVVSIRNTALADGPAPLIGEVELKPPFQLPVTFAVPYDPAAVHPNPMFYSISARVSTIVDGSEKLYYINDTAHHVFRTADDTKCDIAVKKLR